MRNLICSLAYVFFVTCLFVSAGEAKDTRDKSTGRRFMEIPRPAANPPDIMGTVHRAAAVGTTVLGWWQFDDPSGLCDPQAWKAKDLTAQLKTYFHVDGNDPGDPNCHAISPLDGEKSMWCGQWVTTADPWCAWATLPGYGNGWVQSLVSDTIVCDTLNWSWTVVWDTEPYYDRAYAEYWDDTHQIWENLSVSGGPGYYDGTGGPAVESFEVVPPGGWTSLRYRFESDYGWSDEDSLYVTNEGAIKVDDVTVACRNGPTYFHDFEAESCGDTLTLDGFWEGVVPEPYGIYAHLVHGSTVVQEDPCYRELSCHWAFFDDPAVTNYACGGWPAQGAMPWGPDENGLYLYNEIWSPWIANDGTGTEYILSFLTYRDLPLYNFQFYTWRVRTKSADGCPTVWKRPTAWLYYGSQKDWLRTEFQVGNYIPGDAEHIQVALGVFDACAIWGCWYTSCHSHAPLFDDVRLLRVDNQGPTWVVRHIDLWQDNFPEEGGVDPVSSFARCDMAQDILPIDNGNILPGDSLVVDVTDPNGLSDDNAGGRPGKAVYAFVRVTDRWDNPKTGKNGTAIQSPDDRAYAADPDAGMLRWPWVGSVTADGAQWDQYRMDIVYTSGGVPIENRYCCDLMDLGSGPTGPHYNHVNENTAANVGIFTPGDVINYFFGAQNTLAQWSYWHRTLNGQGEDHFTKDIDEAAKDPCEWSVLPDAGLLLLEEGDILFVDDADDRGGPAQAYFDWAFRYLDLEDRVDRFDVLGPSSAVGNSLASRVKNVQVQMIAGPGEIYQKILWNSSNLGRYTGLIGDGGGANGGCGREKSDDYSLLDFFLTYHPDNPGVYAAADNLADEWSGMCGTGAVNVRSTYMNYYIDWNEHDHKIVGEPISPLVTQSAGSPIGPPSMVVSGGCPGINDFDVPAPIDSAFYAMEYETPGNGAVIAQATTNVWGTTARFVLSGFGYDFIRDDTAGDPPDRVTHLRDILIWFENVVEEPVGIDGGPVAFENRLENSYPNPFNPTTTIAYAIKESSHVKLKVYNAAGQLVKTLVDETQTPRADGFSVTWNGTNDAGHDVSSGVYFYRLVTKGFSKTKKTVLLK